MSLEILSASFSDISLGADISPTEIMRAASFISFSASHFVAKYAWMSWNVNQINKDRIVT